MDPINGGSVEAGNYSPPIKTEEEKAAEDSTETDDKPIVEDKAQTAGFTESKKTLESNRPGSTKTKTEVKKEVVGDKTGSSLLGISNWASNILAPKSGTGLRDAAKDLLVEGLSSQVIVDKENDLSTDDQAKKLAERLKPLVENDKTITAEEKKQSLASIPKLISGLPTATKADEANLRATMQDVFGLESIPKQERQGHFIDIAKSALEASSLDQDQKTQLLQDVVKAASPDISEQDLKSFANIVNVLPNETPKEKEIFRDTINKLDELNKDSEISNLERTTKTVGEVLDAFSKYRDSAVDDAASKEIYGEQKQAIEDLIGSSLNSDEISDGDKALIARVTSDLVMNLDDNPETRENEIIELLDFTTKATNVNLESMSEMKDFAFGLNEKISKAYGHLGREGQVDLASRITGDVFNNLEIAKEYGFDQVSDPVLKEGVGQIFDAVNSDSSIFDDPKVQTEALKGINHIVSALSSENKSKLVEDTARLAFSRDGNLTATEQAIMDISKDAVSSLSEEQINQLIDFGTSFVASDAKASDVLGDQNILAAKLNLDPGLTGDAQRTIADIGVQAFQSLAAKSGSPVNLQNMTALLSPGPNGVVGNDGVLDNRDSARIAHQVAENIIDNPISPEERSSNAQANSQKEAQHQSEVRRQAHGQIHQTANYKEAQARGRLPFGGFFANGIINRKRANQEGAAHYTANNWYPGKPGNDQVTRGMNQGYFSSQGQAHVQMRQGVVNEAYGQISQALNNPSSQKSLNMLSQMLNKSSLPKFTKTGTMRIDDMRSLQSLEGIEGSLNAKDVSMDGPENFFAGGEDLDVNKLLGIKPDVEVQKSIENKEHGHFDTFKDKNTNEEFYRLIDKNNQTKYAIKKEDGGYTYLEGHEKTYNGKSYGSVIDDFEAKHPPKLKLGSIAVKGGVGDSFDMFSDESTGQDLYRRIDSNGNVIFALKSEDSKSGWKKIPSDNKLRGRDYGSLISEFEKQNPRSEMAKSVQQQKQAQILTRTQQNSQNIQPGSTLSDEGGSINIRKTTNGVNGSEFIYFNDHSGKSFYAIKERNGKIKLRIGNERSGTPVGADYKYNGVDYSWMIRHLR